MWAKLVECEDLATASALLLRKALKTFSCKAVLKTFFLKTVLKTFFSVQNTSKNFPFQTSSKSFLKTVPKAFSFKTFPKTLFFSKQFLKLSLSKQFQNLSFFPECHVPNGKFRDPADIYGYFECEKGTVVKKSCPNGQQWYPAELKCKTSLGKGCG